MSKFQKKIIMNVNLKNDMVDIIMHLTFGESLAVKHAIEVYKDQSPVGAIVNEYMRKAEIIYDIDVPVR